ncbi:MAG: hypothetical protein JNK73_07730 [Bacteroidia bacterium]|nr:hypothetical protein [Bacteroidia bacterium]
MLNPFQFQDKCHPLKALAVFVLAFVMQGIQAQNFYTTNPDYIQSKTEGNNIFSTYRASYPDTSITAFHQFFPRNFLGNTGLASAPLFLKYGSPEAGFRFFEAPTQMDRILEEDITYYHTKGPYADLSGIAGSKQLQIFNANFTHTFKNRINIGFKLNRYNSVGYYNKQQTFANNILFTNNYISKNARFGYYGYWLGNLNKNRENGGIKDSVLNDSTVLLNKGIMDVKLDSAARENREFKVMFNPWFKLNARRDSHPEVLHLLSVKSSYASHKYRYKDQGVADDNYYSSFYWDSLYTSDSAHVTKFSNAIEYSLLSQSGFGLNLGSRNESNRVWQKNDSVFFNQTVFGGVQFRKDLKHPDSLSRFKRQVQSRVDFEYVFLGPNSGNYKLENKNTLYYSNLIPEIRLNLLFENRNPDHIYKQWQSNHFYWQNNFKNVQQFQANLRAALGKVLSAGVLFQSIENYLYYTTDALPQQHESGISNLSFDLKFSRLFFKHLGLSVDYIYQQSSNEKLIRLPKNNATVNLFYYASLFKNNMQIQLGAQAQAYQSFETYAYMPATQVFYLQNGFYTGDFPFVDVYLNARIRPASFFVKIENVLAGIAGTNFAMIQGYYQPQSAFRFGLKWMFFD